MRKNYLIWWIEGLHQKNMYAKKEFSEHTSMKAWNLEINRLKKNKIVSNLKYIEL